MGSDIFGFGEVIHRADPQAWKNMEKRIGTSTLQKLPLLSIQISKFGEPESLATLFSIK
ncbi:Ger(x)C family spore germination C-terminal domain-containing protein [Paenibacillus rhizoplanae]